jgi:hypothetical protein
MRIPSFLCALAAILFSHQANGAGAACATDASYIASGWVISHPSDWTALTKALLARYQRERAEFVFDTEGRFRDSTSGRIYLARSFDRLSTPRPEMYGDFLVIMELNKGKIAEIRWYEKGKKHLAYDPDYQRCASSLFPWAGNALF